MAAQREPAWGAPAKVGSVRVLSNVNTNARRSAQKVRANTYFYRAYIDVYTTPWFCFLNHVKAVRVLLQTSLTYLAKSPRSKA